MGAGQVLGGRYELVDRLAAPGRRVVWTARDRRAERTVAVQVVAGAALSDEDAGRLVRDARAGAVLAGHPNVLAVLDAGHEDGTAHVVTEHAAGRSLEEVLAADGVPDPARAADWARGLCEGLAAGHAAGLLHGDVRPATVLVTADGTPRLMDFGIAGALGQDQPGGTGGSLAGVPWMSPERVRGEEEVDPRSDLYALGCLLYQLLAGVTPFGHREVTLQLGAHLREAPVAPGRHRPGVPAGLDALVLDLLAKEPGDRPGSAAEVAGRLAVLARQAGAAVDTTAGAAVGEEAAAVPSGAFAATGFPTVATTTVVPAPAPAVDLLAGHGADGFGPDDFHPARRERASLRRGGLVAGCTALAVALVAGLVWAVAGSTGGSAGGNPPRAAGSGAAIGAGGDPGAPNDLFGTTSGSAAPSASGASAPAGSGSPGAPGTSAAPGASGAPGATGGPSGPGGSPTDPGAPGASGTAPATAPPGGGSTPTPGRPPASPSTAAAAYGCSGGLVGSYPVATGAGAVLGYYYLFYDNSSGKNCAATIKTSASGYGTASAVKASISRCSNSGPAANCTKVAGTTANDAGNFTMYAGPVRVAAAGACITGYGSITWGGVTATTAASLGNQAVHCG